MRFTVKSKVGEESLLPLSNLFNNCDGKPGDNDYGSAPRVKHEMWNIKSVHAAASEWNKKERWDHPLWIWEEQARLKTKTVYVTCITGCSSNCILGPIVRFRVIHQRPDEAKNEKPLIMIKGSQQKQLKVVG